MDYYYLTGKFTLIPHMFFTQKSATEALKEVHNVEKSEVIQTFFIQYLNADLVYALPCAVIAKVEADDKVFPLALYFLHNLKEIKEYNKVIFHFSAVHGVAHILISKGDELVLLNAYHTETFTSAVYFLFLALKQTIINSHQTKLQVYNNISEEEKKVLQPYFSGIEQCSMDSKINLL